MSATSADANLRAALTLLEALRRCGLRWLVLCPGSRSAPLAVAAGVLASRGLEVLTAVDERSAAFLALGLGRADGLPAAVVTTSGTAVANLLPAVVEADYGAIPLLLLTADRPEALKNCGANQTVNQQDFLRANCRLMQEGPTGGLHEASAAALEELAGLALAACGGPPPGPVHLNLPFAEPLHGTRSERDAVEAVLLGDSASDPIDPPSPSANSNQPSGMAVGAPPVRLDPDQPGVVVAGPWRGAPQEFPSFLAALRRWQERSGWPVFADALSGLRGCGDLALVAGYDLLLEDPSTGEGPAGRPQVLRLGPQPASRRLERWLQRPGGAQLLVSEGEPRRLDPLGTAAGQDPRGLVRWLAEQEQARSGNVPSEASRRHGAAWLERDARLQHHLDAALLPGGRGGSGGSGSGDGGGELNEPALARWLSRHLPQGLPLMLANSSPVRDWESFGDPGGPARPVYAFRGASGIDGTLSIACGLAEALGRAVLVSGDLALLHDSNGWLWHRQLSGQLTVLLIDNGGGGIFEQLPVRGGADPQFEQLFAMPQAVEARALAAAHGVPSCAIEGWASLAEGLAWALEQPVALLEVRTDRRRDAALRQRLRTMAPPSAGAA
ncbi:MAG: 2-succinyl-5-enolpyruvyl-6-hydroxy-3-cyclohexene-1-carboxylic-acid synthase [Synechococcus sp.]|nr:2-succinyl-5-enolpyruvyl-6-hydroxy-3-cyclohexene-1-carboxylic-acid synthase [Synechococcus sp.]